MHGIIRPVVDTDQLQEPSWQSKLHAWSIRNRAFLLIVVLPTLLVAGYYYLLATDQYRSEAHFMVKSSQNNTGAASGLGALLSLGGGMTQSHTDAMSVVDYLLSNDAVTEIDRRLGLVARFRPPEADVLSRLGSATPPPETLLKYYRKHVDVKFDTETGITSLTVQTFRPTDSLLIAERLLKMGEDRVNMLNQRSYADALSTADRQLREAESALQDIQVKLTQFRRTSNDIDPIGTGRAQLSMVTQLNAGLTTARAQLQSMRGIISPSSPQYVATVARVRALESQVAAQEGRLVGNGSAIASNIGGYENLQVRQEFASKRYTAAAAAYENAREDARKKQLYLIRVVNPNLPVKSLFPERGRIVLTVFAALLIAYGIGWLLMAGVREHANG